MIEIVSDDVFDREPTAILEAFLLFEKTPGVKGLSARTLRALYNARKLMNQKWRRDPVNRQLFIEILKQAARRHACDAAVEPDQCAGTLPAQLPAHRRPDAA